MRGLLVLLGCCLLSACATVQVAERNFIRPDRVSGAKPAGRFDAAALPPAASLKDEALAVADGAVARGVSVSQPGAPATVLYFGGNMFHLDAHGAEVAAVLAGCGVNVVMFDYRGYGRSDGEPTIATMQSDALRIYDHVNAQHPGRVIVHGQSLGSFIAAYVAQQRLARALVLESTTTNALDWANANTPWYARPFVSIELSAPLRGIDTIAALRDFGGASLVLIGERDRTTPPALAHKVYQAIPGRAKSELLVAGAGHNDVLTHPDTAPAYCAFVRRASL